MRRHGTLAVLAIILGLGAPPFIGCSVYDSSLLHRAAADASADVAKDVSLPPDGNDLPDGGAEPDSSGGEDAATEEAAVDPRACDNCKDPALLRPVCPPTVVDSPSLPQPIVYAVRSMRVGMDMDQPKDWKTIGYDLDCLMTGTDGKDAPCLRAPGAKVGVEEDGELGRDNSFGKNFGGLVILLESLKSIDNLEVDNNTRLEEGNRGMLLQVEDFNGGKNDPIVRVSLMMSKGTLNPSTNEAVPAKWDGTDVWSVDASSLAPNSVPLFQDDAGFVVDGVLVAHLPNGLAIKFGGSTVFSLNLNESVLTMRLSDDLKKASEGVLAGVWHTASALTSLDDFAGQSGTCPDNPYYATARKAVEQSSDIRLDLQPKPNMECNAMSIALGFTAEQALRGVAVPTGPQPPNLCLDAGTDAK